MNDPLLGPHNFRSNNKQATIASFAASDYSLSDVLAALIAELGRLIVRSADVHAVAEVSFRALIACTQHVATTRPGELIDWLDIKAMNLGQFSGETTNEEIARDFHAFVAPILQHVADELELDCFTAALPILRQVIYQRTLQHLDADPDIRVLPIFVACSGIQHKLEIGEGEAGVAALRSLAEEVLQGVSVTGPAVPEPAGWQFEPQLFYECPDLYPYPPVEIIAPPPICYLTSLQEAKLARLRQRQHRFETEALDAPTELAAIRDEIKGCKQLIANAHSLNARLDPNRNQADDHLAQI